MLTITQANIDKAREEKAGDVTASQCCPIEQALKEAHPGKNISANYYALRIRDTYYQTTKKMFRFMANFDDGLKVSPTSFRLLKMDELVL